VQKELVALKKSEDELRETVGALSSEVARLKAESARWKHLARQPSTQTAEARLASNHRVAAAVEILLRCRSARLLRVRTWRYPRIQV